MPNSNDRQDRAYSDSLPGVSGGRRSLWMPASTFYVLATSISAAFFFLVWGILHDIGEEMPWVTAGVSSSILMSGTVILREIILRRNRNRMIRQQRNLDFRFRSSGFTSGRHPSNNPNKLTLERNAAIVGEIRKKSDAAKVLNKLSSGHREVFELCREYLTLNESELKMVNAGSPRLAPLLKGRSAAADFHHYHMLRWAEIEARTLTNEARNRANTDGKIEAAQNALNVIESALQSYPSESSLLQSQELLREMVVSIKVSCWVESAERAAFQGNYAQAKGLYRDALFYLGRDNVYSDDRERAAIRINEEIERLRDKEMPG